MSLTKQEVHKILYESVTDIFNTLRMSAQLHAMELGGRGDALPNRLTLRTGATLRALMGTGARDRATSIATAKPSGDGIQLEYGVQLPWGALHEVGGVRPITEPMRKFYWARYFNEQNPQRKTMWKILALFKTSIKYPPRPFLFPTVENADTQNKIQEHLYDAVERILNVNYTFMIKDAKT